MMKFFRTTLLTSILFGASFAHAALEIRIDFSNNEGTPGGNWNLIQTGVAPNALTDFNTGSSSGASLSLVTMSTDNGFSVNWTGGNLGGWMEDSAGDDLIGTTSSGQVVIDGLGSTVVQIELVSAWFDNQVSGTYQIDGNNANRTQTGDPVDDPWQGNADGTANYLIWDSITPTLGAVTIDLTNTSNIAGISALRITQVPEPAAWGLMLGFASLALVVVRLRRKSS
ncbi:PEP-CTERM sorting domain-containing protein [Rubellicoccus peritrichatus]|uniref:PEP-CTERM protein-sorting domain-containing protein n=1 Tax=Rubellicoccus peritrichatus TaxID=3080537 RepID=A0AAQ3LC41_9BACT|nr:PEP-CTERM sorting domain-containing protein [Puniceicoccus sp. CR14]WOO42671.1 hypothetical protein RZN69_06170 [Puniceicoccus sp. CR14]